MVCVTVEFFFFNVLFPDTADSSARADITCTRRITTPLSLHYMEARHLSTNLLAIYSLTLYSLTALLLRVWYCAALTLGTER